MLLKSIYNILIIKMEANGKKFSTEINNRHSILII